MATSTINIFGANKLKMVLFIIITCLYATLTSAENDITTNVSNRIELVNCKKVEYANIINQYNILMCVKNVLGDIPVNLAIKYKQKAYLTLSLDQNQNLISIEVENHNIASNNELIKAIQKNKNEISEDISKNIHVLYVVEHQNYNITRDGLHEVGIFLPFTGTEIDFKSSSYQYLELFKNLVNRILTNKEHRPIIN